MDIFVQDLRQAWRALAGRPAFTITIVVSLALGIGANTTIFSILDAVLLRPLPFVDEGRLVSIRAQPQAEEALTNVSPLSFSAVSEQSEVFEGVCAQGSDSANLIGSEEPQHVIAGYSGANCLGLLGVRPILGRGFMPEEDRPGARGQVVLLGHDLWRRQFGGDPQVIDRTVLIDDQRYTVIGVMPRNYDFPWFADLWVPLALDPLAEDPRHSYLYLVGRLKAGVKLARAQAELDAIAGRIAADHPDIYSGARLIARPLRQDLIENNEDKMLLVLLATSGFLLLIACANVANMLLARALEQSSEIAVRAVLGAGRVRLLRQLLTQGLALSFFSGGVALLLALSILRPLLAASPMMDMFALLRAVRIDLRVFGFTLLVAVVAGCLFSLVPALKASNPNLQILINEGSSRATASRAGRRLLSALVIIEIATTVILLVGTGLMLRTLRQLQQINPGFDPEHTLVTHLSMSPIKYPEERDRVAVFREIITQLEALPEVISAATTTTHPLDIERTLTRITVPDRPARNRGDFMIVNHRLVSPGYFETLRIPLLQGRLITAQDRADSQRVAVVSKRLADTCWPGEDPINKRLKRGAYDSDAPVFTVVGVVGDVPDRGDYDKTWYLPHTQNTFSWQVFTLVARTAGDPTPIVPDIRRQIHAVDSQLPIADVATSEQLLRDVYGEEHFIAFLIGLFGALGLTLTVIGIFGILSYFVAQQSVAIDMRMALGAQRRDVLGFVMRQGIGVGVIGVVVGCGGAMALTRFLGSVLHGVSPIDLGVYVSISVATLAVVMMASYLPARSATRVDPITILRTG